MELVHKCVDIYKILYGRAAVNAKTPRIPDKNVCYFGN